METMFSASASALRLIDQLIASGGVVMAVLMAMAVIGLVAFVYLVLYGALCAPRQPGSLKRAVRQWQQNPDQSVADELRFSRSILRTLNPLHHLVLATMEGRLQNRPSSQIQESVSQKAQHALTPFEAPLKVIEVIAALAPLLGLLGTVMGMMDAFSTMAASEGRASATQLSGGIYQALTTTAAGLIVAIPFAAIAAWIEFRLRRLQTSMNNLLFDTLNTTQTDRNDSQVTGPQTGQPSARSRVSEIDWRGHQAINAVR